MHELAGEAEGERHELAPGDAVLHAIGAHHLIDAIVETRWIERSPPSATWPAVGPDPLRR